jgi:hypothetical protein
MAGVLTLLLPLLLLLSSLVYPLGRANTPKELDDEELASAAAERVDGFFLGAAGAADDDG